MERPITTGDDVFVMSAKPRLDDREGRVLECLPRKLFRVALLPRKRQLYRSNGVAHWFTEATDPADTLTISLLCLRHKWPNPRP